MQVCIILSSQVTLRTLYQLTSSKNLTTFLFVEVVNIIIVPNNIDIGSVIAVAVMGFQYFPSLLIGLNPKTKADIFSYIALRLQPTPQSIRESNGVS